MRRITKILKKVLLLSPDNMYIEKSNEAEKKLNNNKKELLSATEKLNRESNELYSTIQELVKRISK